MFLTALEATLGYAIGLILSVLALIVLVVGVAVFTVWLEERKR